MFVEITSDEWRQSSRPVENAFENKMRIMPQEQPIENGRWRRLHPWPVRVMHWNNALAVVMMNGSGWRIYNNDPIFPAIYFPIALTLGGNEELTYKLHGDAGFGNALLWHFAFMCSSH